MIFRARNFAKLSFKTLQSILKSLTKWDRFLKNVKIFQKNEKAHAQLPVSNSKIKLGNNGQSSKKRATTTIQVLFSLFSLYFYYCRKHYSMCILNTIFLLLQSSQFDLLDLFSGVNISHKYWNFSGTASENFKTFPRTIARSLGGPESIMSCMMLSGLPWLVRGSSLFFFLICQIRIPKFLEKLFLKLILCHYF